MERKIEKLKVGTVNHSLQWITVPLLFTKVKKGGGMVAVFKATISPLKNQLIICFEFFCLFPGNVSSLPRHSPFVIHIRIADDHAGYNMLSFLDSQKIKDIFIVF